MASKQDYQAPRRKEPGIIGNSFSVLVQFITWLVISLIVSIGIEWIGMTYYWTEQGSNHARNVLIADQAYLNQQLVDKTIPIKASVIQWTATGVDWIGNLDWLKPNRNNTQDSSNGVLTNVIEWANDLRIQYKDYLQAGEYVSQTFVIRLGLIVFSLPIFVLAMWVGAVDGLIERDLRRWGGGRESSNVFTLAKNAITPIFVLACVIYISLPFSLDPVVIILPFAVLVGLSMRITFERLKKYF
ncbi:MAG: TIGR03747 family integrating conjugative element membrane protein [SAR86 cluster bacterium]|uniref:TIGR03747 family integrating conjugative element membrane protein n=1 Tax=SAR86 cluster bacterium TaxID=2030880 RepID=A0A2A5CIK1_9GAMM|nr:MAG: TIGR03747 family integrating conjugative element membrane protein [SAR86 cluster bacterium]